MQALLTALKAVAEPTRLRILALCAHSDLTVSDLTQILGQSQPRVSRHLKLLCDAGLLERQREGAWAYFRLAPSGAVAELAQGLVDGLPEEDPQLTLDFERLQAIIEARAQRAASYFRSNAAKWDRIRSLYIDETEVERRLLALFPPGAVGDLLDIGTGTGRVIEILAPRVRRAVGIDLSHEMLLVARSKLEQARLRNCMVRQGDMYQLPLAGASFDAVTIHQVLHYAERPAEVIREAARVLRPGGQLVVADFAEHENDDLRREHAHLWLGFSEEEVAAWFADAGLQARDTMALPGETLTVMIWSAARPAIAAAA